MIKQQLLETIKIINGNYQNLEFHQWRVNWSRAKLNLNDKLTITLPKPPQKGIFKARMLYLEKVDEVQIFPYQKPKIETLKLVYCDDIDYSLKYENRRQLTNLKKRYSNGQDDILIIKKGLITDTSIANVVFFDGIRWITPKQPLLKGTTRERLLKTGQIFEKDIFVEEISKFKRVGITNALLGFYEIENIIV